MAELPTEVAEVLRGERRWCVLNADCSRLLETLPDDSFTHIITDPPYEVEAHTKARRQRSKGVVGVLEIGFDAITEPMRLRVAQHSIRVAAKWVLAFCQVEAVAAWRAGLGESYRRAMVWVKPDSAPQFTGDRPGMGYECIAVAWGGPRRSSWNGGGKRGVLFHPVGVFGGEKNVHPTQKPLPLMHELIELFTDPGDVILDPFCGSASTGVAALHAGRRFVGVEVRPEWADVSRERLEAASNGCGFREHRAGQSSFGFTGAR